MHGGFAIIGVMSRTIPVGIIDEKTLPALPSDSHARVSPF